MPGQLEIEQKEAPDTTSGASPASTFNNPVQTRRVCGRPFEKGNKFGKGRTAGSRNNATIALQALLDGEGEAITRKAVELALGGDTTALKLVLERLIPPARDRRIQLELPALSSLAGVSEAMSTTVQAVGRGALTPAEGQAVANMLESQRKSIESLELERRIQVLEARASAETRN